MKLAISTNNRFLLLLLLSSLIAFPVFVAGTNHGICPNGIVEEPEQCDDNNSINGDGCSNLCNLECGDGSRDIDGSDGYSEECDSGSSNGQVCTIPVGNQNCAYCGEDCRIEIFERPLSIVGGYCNTASDCYSLRCQFNTCLRGTGRSGSSCTRNELDDECDYGLSCRSNSCSLKALVGEACTTENDCISGVCESSVCGPGDAFALCAIVNDQAYQISDRDIKEIVARASDLLYERTKIKMRLLTPVERKNVRFQYGVHSAAEWIDECYRNHPHDQPNGALVFAGDPNVLGSSGGHTVSSTNLLGEGYCNSYASPIYGPGLIIGGNLDYTRNYLDLAWKTAHEILHYFGYNGNNDHFETSLCRLIMGDMYSDAVYSSNTFSLAHWFGMCPHTFNNFANIQKDAACNFDNVILNGAICNSDMDCFSGFCGTAQRSTVKQCMANELELGQFCLTDNQCRSGTCTLLKCS